MGGNPSSLVAVLRQIDNVLTIILHLRFLTRTDLSGRVRTRLARATESQGRALAPHAVRCALPFLARTSKGS